MGEKLYLILYELSKLILSFIVGNVLWIMVNLPVLVLTMQLAVTTDLTNLMILLPLITLLIPILFFPGLQALFSSVRALIREDRFINPVSFFKYYTSGFKNSFFIGVLFTGMIMISGYLIYINREGSIIFSTVLFVLVFYISIVAFFSLIMEVHYDMTIVWKIRRAFFYILKSPFFSVSMFIIFILVQYIIFTVSSILYILFGLTLTVYATLYLSLRRIV